MDEAVEAVTTLREIPLGDSVDATEIACKADECVEPYNEPRAMVTKAAKSLFVPRPWPSAMFAGMDSAARTVWWVSSR